VDIAFHDTLCSDCRLRASSQGEFNTRPNYDDSDQSRNYPIVEAGVTASKKSSLCGALEPAISRESSAVLEKLAPNTIPPKQPVLYAQLGHADVV
jgi:hypothetical protein